MVGRTTTTKGDFIGKISFVYFMSKGNECTYPTNHHRLFILRIYSKGLIYYSSVIHLSCWGFGVLGFWHLFLHIFDCPKYIKSL